ncbi:MAG: hypothetical protein ACM3UP_01735, partial [Methanocella sp.]
LYYLGMNLQPRLPKAFGKPTGYVFDHIYVLRQLYITKPERWRNEFLRPLEALVESCQGHVRLEFLGLPPNWVELLT